MGRNSKYTGASNIFNNQVDSPESVHEEAHENRSNNPKDSSKHYRHLSAMFGGNGSFKNSERKATVMFNINETKIHDSNKDRDTFEEKDISLDQSRERGDTMIFKEEDSPALIPSSIEDIDKQSLLSTRSKKDYMEVL